MCYFVILTKWFWNESCPRLTRVWKFESYMWYFVMNPEYPLIYLYLVRRVCHRYLSRNIFGFEEEMWTQSEAHKQILLHPNTAIHADMNPWFLQLDSWPGSARAPQHSSLAGGRTGERGGGPLLPGRVSQPSSAAQTGAGRRAVQCSASIGWMLREDARRRGGRQFGPLERWEGSAGGSAALPWPHLSI